MESDATQSASLLKLWAWFEANKKQVVMGAIALTVVGLLVWFLIYRHAAQEAQAGQALASVFVPVSVTGGNPGPNTAKEYLKVAETYPGYDGGAEAMLLAASTCYTEGSYDQAKGLFEKFLRDHRGSPLRSQALLGIAACYNAQNKTNDAITAYKSVIDQHPNDPAVPQAKFSLANLYEAQGKPELARNLFEEVARARYTSLGSEAGMRLEELFQKHPNLAPQPSAAMNPAAMTSTNALLTARSNAPAVAPAKAPAPAPAPKK